MSDRLTANAKRPGRWGRRFFIIAVVLALIGLLLPTIIARTAMRDRLINSIIATPSLSVTTEKASFGWFSPLSIDGLNIAGELNRFEVEVESVVAERAWPRLLASSPDLGRISIEKPHIRLTLPLGEIGTRSSNLSPTFIATINDAAVTVNHDQSVKPIIDVTDVDLIVNVQDSEQGLVMSLDPVDVFTREKLTPQHCNSLLQMISPSLSDATQIDGEFSLSIAKLSIPIGVTNGQLMERFEAEGELDLHQVSIVTNNALLETLTKLIADTRNKQIPAQTRVVKDSAIKFQVRGGRLYHEGLRFGFPDIDPELEISAYGSVGFDQTLDVYLEVPRLDSGKQHERGPVQCHVTGTLSNPRLSAKDASLVVHLPGRLEPLIDVDGVDFTMRLEQSASGRVIAFEPMKLLDREKLNRRLASSLLHLVEPELRYSPQLEGEVSLSVDILHIPVGVSDEEWLKALKVHGTLVIHQANSLAQTPIRQAIVKLLCDMYGKSPLDVVRVAHDTEVEFELREGRFHYEGLQIGFPDIAPSLEILSYGSIGLDESLDVHLEVPPLDSTKQQERGPVMCHVTGTVSKPQFSAKDASLVVHLPNRTEPLIDVDGVDFTMRVEQAANGFVMSFDPIELLDREKLDRRLASSLLQLVEPDLQYSPQLEGEVSLSVDTLRIPVGGPNEAWLAALEVHGKLVIHEASSLAKTPIRQAVVKLLCDIYGKKPVDLVRVAHDAEIDFELRKGRFHYEGLRIGFPDIDAVLNVVSHGSIGLDETLDVHLEMTRLDREKQKERGPVKCHVTGTVSNPHLSVKDASLVLRLAGNEQPVLDVDSVDLSMKIQHQKEKPILIVDAVQVFDRQKLTPELSNELLRLVVPTLGDITDVEGEISLSIDSCEIPLSGSTEEIFQSVRLSGQLQLHEITTRVETPLLRAMVKILADRYGKKPSDTIRVVKDADIRFELRDGKLFHDGLRIGFPDLSPDLVCRLSGAVGLDGSLNLLLDVPGILAGASGEGSGEIHFQVTGTVNKPSVVEVK